MFVESFLAVDSNEFDEGTVQEIVTELDSRNSERWTILQVVGYGAVVLTTVVENRAIDSDTDVGYSVSCLTWDRSVIGQLYMTIMLNTKRAR